MPGRTKKIIRWVYLSLLIFLLGTAIVLQTPWKIISLLLVFLLASTVLPKHTRKFFWLGVGTVIIALIIWVFLPDDDEGWRPYKLDEEFAAFEAKYAIPPEEDAAKIYRQLLDSNEANCPSDLLDKDVEKHQQQYRSGGGMPDGWARLTLSGFGG